MSKYGLAIALGYLGLIPFVLLALLTLIFFEQPFTRQLLLPLFEHYSALIIVFLSGALWAEALVGRSICGVQTLLIMH